MIQKCQFWSVEISAAWLLRGALMWSLLMLAGFASPAMSAETSLSVKGSTTIHPLAQRIASAFEKTHPDIRVAVSGGGSLLGIEALIEGRIDIATSSTFIPETQLVEAIELGKYPVPFKIANDCILPVVHRSNALDGISQEDLRRIYTGELTNWLQLGGPDLEIVVIQRNSDSGTFDVWQQLVMRQKSSAESALVTGSNADVVAAVASDPGAIGYIGLSFLSASIKPLSVDGVMGSSRSLRAGNYPISRPLFLFTDGWPEGLVLQFVNFVLDPDAGQKIIADEHYVPLW